MLRKSTILISLVRLIILFIIFLIYSSPNMRFPFLTPLRYAHCVQIVLAISSICLAILLAGCTSDSPGLPHLYLISLSYQNPVDAGSTTASKNGSSLLAPLLTNARLTVRTGYFGLCISPDNSRWTCSRDIAILTQSINATMDPLDLISISNVFKDKIVFSGLLYDFSIDYHLFTPSFELTVR